MDNTVGSLTQVQKSVLIGSLLGDGYVRIVPGRKDAFMEVNHSIAQKEYVDWKYKMLGNLVARQPKAYKNNGKRIGYDLIHGNILKSQNYSEYFTAVVRKSFLKLY